MSAYWGSGYRGLQGSSEPDLIATDLAWQGQPASAVLDLPPLAVVLLGSRRANAKLSR